MTQLQPAVATESLRSWPCYPAYKDSGITTLGEVPVHWGVKRLKYVARLEYGEALSAQDREPGDIPVFGSNGIVGEHSRANTLAPCLVVGRKGSFGKVVLSDVPSFVIDTAYFIDRSRTVQEFRWLYYSLLCLRLDEISQDTGVPGLSSTSATLTRAQPTKSGLTLGEQRTTSRRPSPAISEICTKRTTTKCRCSTRELAHNSPMPVPPLPEQRAIAAFLDRETARLDALVTAKERLIALLQEKRDALINHAVTRGLDPAASMKDSGVSWLGEIPEHWEVKRTKYVARLESGHTPSRQHPEYWVNCTIPWVSLADVWQLRDGLREYVEDTSEYVSELGIANSSARLLPAGTVIVSRTASVGFSGIMARPMATTKDFANWVCGPYVRSEYLLYVFRSMEHEFRRLTMGSTHQTIYMPDIGSFTTPVPPLSEQDAIVAHIRLETGKIDALTSKVKRHIDKLKEYRAALISAAATGKIDVRDQVAANE